MRLLLAHQEGIKKKTFLLRFLSLHSWPSEIDTSSLLCECLHFNHNHDARNAPYGRHHHCQVSLHFLHEEPDSCSRRLLEGKQ